MEKAPQEQEHHTNALPYENCRQKHPQFKGIRLRKWGSWGSEIRVPRTRAKIWLGSYKTAEEAARAYDAAAYCLRGPNAQLNFPNSIPSIPSAFSLSRHQIQLAAAKYARDELPSAAPSIHRNNSNNAISLSSPFRSSKISETELWSNMDQISSSGVSGSLLPTAVGAPIVRICSPLTTPPSALDFTRSWQEEVTAMIHLCRLVIYVRSLDK